MSNSDTLELAFIYLQDCQRLIAAGKVQRWEVLKWAVTVNVALAAAAAATGARGTTLLGLFGFCVFVAAVSIYLLYHYNRRMTGARDAMDKIMERLSTDFPDIEKFTGKDRYPATQEKLARYDKEEMAIFPYIIGFSILPAFVVLAIKLL
jgi:hypothetical protein